MIGKKFLRILACPNCYGDLKREKNRLVCQKCGQVYKTKRGIPILISGKVGDDVELSKDRWEKLHREQALGSRNRKSDKTIQSYKKFLSKYEKDFKNGVFLDLGCGIARVSSLLAEEGVSILGIDISFEAVWKSSLLFKQEGFSGFFLQGNLLHLPILDNSIQFIYSCMSLEYLRDTQQAISETYRILKPLGKIVAIVPVISLTTLTYHQLRGDIPNLPVIRDIMEWLHLRVLRGKYMDYGYEQSFTLSLLRKLFTNANFKVENIDFFDVYYPISFIPKIVRSSFRRILKYRPFWPLVFVEAKKLG